MIMTDTMKTDIDHSCGPGSPEARRPQGFFEIGLRRERNRLRRPPVLELPGGQAIRAACRDNNQDKG